MVFKNVDIDNLKILVANYEQFFLLKFVCDAGQISFCILKF